MTVDERWIWRVARILDTSLGAGCKGGPEVRERFDSIESLVQNISPAKRVVSSKNFDFLDSVSNTLSGVEA